MLYFRCALLFCIFSPLAFAGFDDESQRVMNLLEQGFDRAFFDKLNVSYETQKKEMESSREKQKLLSGLWDDACEEVIDRFNKRNSGILDSLVEKFDCLKNRRGDTVQLIDHKKEVAAYDSRGGRDIDCPVSSVASDPHIPGNKCGKKISVTVAAGQGGYAHYSGTLKQQIILVGRGMVCNDKNAFSPEKEGNFLYLFPKDALSVSRIHMLLFIPSRYDRFFVIDFCSIGGTDLLGKLDKPMEVLDQECDGLKRSTDFTDSLYAAHEKEVLGKYREYVETFISSGKLTRNSTKVIDLKYGITYKLRVGKYLVLIYVAHKTDIAEEQPADIAEEQPADIAEKQPDTVSL